MRWMRLGVPFVALMWMTGCAGEEAPVEAPEALAGLIGGFMEEHGLG